MALTDRGRPLIGIIGQGYVGLSLVEVFCSHGERVIGVDNNPRRVSELNSMNIAGDIISNSLLKSFVEKHLYFATSDLKAISDCDVVIIAVPTPLDSDNNPDLSILKRACHEIARYLKSNALVINESTSFPGTLRVLIAGEIAGLRDDNAKFLEFACSPERVNPGLNQSSNTSTPRVVSGLTQSSKLRALEFYKKFFKEVHLVSTPEVAELSKLLENSYRLINIAFINELNDFCNKVGMDLREVIQAASTKPFGFEPFFPSVGIGGHCIPVDPEYLLDFAASRGAELPILRASADSNRSHPAKIIRFLQANLGDLSGKSVLIEGVTYKANVADVRESPAEKLRESLLGFGAKVSWHDPLISSWLDSRPSDSMNFDLVILSVMHQNTDLTRVVKSGKIVCDLTGTLKNSRNVLVF